jgi:hypothetical protein
MWKFHEINRRNNTEKLILLLKCQGKFLDINSWLYSFLWGYFLQNKPSTSVGCMNECVTAIEKGNYISTGEGVARSHGQLPRLWKFSWRRGSRMLHGDVTGFPSSSSKEHTGCDECEVKKVPCGNSGPCYWEREWWWLGGPCVSGQASRQFAVHCVHTWTTTDYYLALPEFTWPSCLKLHSTGSFKRNLQAGE